MFIDNCVFVLCDSFLTNAVKMSDYAEFNPNTVPQPNAPHIFVEEQSPSSLSEHCFGFYCLQKQ